MIDVSLSISTQKKLQLIYKMQSTKAKIIELKAKDLEEDDTIPKLKELRKVEQDDLKNQYLA